MKISRFRKFTRIPYRGGHKPENSIIYEIDTNGFFGKPYCKLIKCYERSQTNLRIFLITGTLIHLICYWSGKRCLTWTLGNKKLNKPVVLKSKTFLAKHNIRKK